MTFYLGDKSRQEITEGLDYINKISLKATEKKQLLLPCSLVVGVISSVTLGVFLGAPFFCVGVLVTAASCYAIKRWYLADLEIVDRFRNYFKNREPFHFSDGGIPQKVIEVNYAQFGYSRFILENAK